MHSNLYHSRSQPLAKDKHVAFASDQKSAPGELSDTRLRSDEEIRATRDSGLDLEYSATMKAPQHWRTSKYTEPLTVPPLDVPVAWPIECNGTQVGHQNTIVQTSAMQTSNHVPLGVDSHSSGRQPGWSRSNQNSLDPVPELKDPEPETEEVEELSQIENDKAEILNSNEEEEEEDRSELTFATAEECSKTTTSTAQLFATSCQPEFSNLRLVPL